MTIPRPSIMPKGRLLAVSLLLIVAMTARAADFTIDWWTMDGGGAMGTSGGSYELSGTIGQPDAGVALSGGNFELTGGFWFATPSPQWCLGDSNCSGGAPTFEDITYFVSALSGQAAWETYYVNQQGAPPPCPYLVNDIDGGGVAFDDIEPFVALIGQPCVPF
jgi:hypothetical protein